MTQGTGSGGGEGRPVDPPDDDLLLAHQEEPSVGKRWERVGFARVRREVEHEAVRSEYPRQREQLVQKRVPVTENDSGEVETLPDGSISIPVFEEELVVSRKTVLRERVIISKKNITEWQRVEAELRRERVRFETEDVADGRVSGEVDSRG